MSQIALPLSQLARDSGPQNARKDGAGQSGAGQSGAGQSGAGQSGAGRMDAGRIGEGGDPHAAGQLSGQEGGQGTGQSAGQVAGQSAGTRVSGPQSIIVGNANAKVVEALKNPSSWPYNTAIIHGPSRSGKSLLGRWFAEQGKGRVIDNADQMDETELFHQWNAVQQSGEALLLIIGAALADDPEEGAQASSNQASAHHESGVPVAQDWGAGWQIALPDLKSRLGAALMLEITAPDDAMMGELLRSLAAQRGLMLGMRAEDYLVPRTSRSFAGLEALVEMIDRLSLERKKAATMGIWRAALAATMGPEQPNLL